MHHALAGGRTIVVHHSLLLLLPLVAVWRMGTRCSKA
jgi:hypothetical protein